MGYGVRVRIKGPRACFTRPEMHVERTSYDVITPSAARGILEAVYWKPAIRWVIDRIEVLNPITFDTIRRNEVASKVSYRAAKAAYTSGTGALGVNVVEDRQQRNTLYLRNVDYVVDAHFEMVPERAGEADTASKHYNIALRRLRLGQCFNQPYLGCREFPAEVEAVGEEDELPPSYYEGEASHDLGYMLYDLSYKTGQDPMPQFYRAVMHRGVIDVAAARTAVVA
ncbi:type I-C CRISPR-associated protein Cas5c [uncultured Olsenella sp.]|uniref:type I-C CRISPR-associated protein Cas5c n=1 Tax=uncultured Olsenella sp. TaxID=190764 RepID=UPI0026DC4044|nr:type I-C CRISPR-associated protein Cas5c [uncultured Olsenella sp.]